MDVKYTMQPDRPAKSPFTETTQNARIELCLSLWHKKDTKGLLIDGDEAFVRKARLLQIFLCYESCVFPVFCLEVVR